MNFPPSNTYPLILHLTLCLGLTRQECQDSLDLPTVGNFYLEALAREVMMWLSSQESGLPTEVPYGDLQ